MRSFSVVGKKNEKRLYKPKISGPRVDGKVKSPKSDF